MDYILMSAVKGFGLQQLTISYDIACQWKKNFEERMARLPEDLRLELDTIDVETGLPVWHALAHEDFCASRNSLNYIPGVGRSDGEGVERLWSVLNGSSFHSKEMGLGNRADTIEDKLDAHNYQKNLGQGVCSVVVKKPLLTRIYISSRRLETEAHRRCRGARPSSSGIQRNQQEHLE